MTRRMAPSQHMSVDKPYEIEREAIDVKPREIVYLDKKARLPYYVEQNGNLVMFDPDLGLKLRLSDGDISTLMGMDADLE